MICAMYLRKSRADAELEREGEFETLKRHEKILREYASKNDIHIVEVYKELVSGESIDNRPEMQRLLEDVSDRKYEGVLVVEIERLARGNGIDQCIIIETFKSADCLIVTPTKTFDCNNASEEQFFELGLMLSRFEYKTIRKRLERGRLQSAKDGTFLSRLPYGYKADKKRKLVPDDNAKWVRYIFEEYANGVITSVIGKKLESMNVLSPAGNHKWNKCSIVRILKNPVYTGRYVYGKTCTATSFNVETHKTEKIKHYKEEPKVTIENNHEAIIPMELFEQANKIISSKAVTSHNPEHLNSPFAGLLKCGICKKASFTVTETKVKNKRYHYIIHVNKFYKGCDYNNSKIRLDLFTSKFISTMKSELDNIMIEIETGEHSNDVKTKKEQLQKELDKNNSKLKKCYSLFEDDIYTKEEFLERRSIYQNTINNLKDELEKLDNEPDTDEMKNFSVMLHDVIDSIQADEISNLSKNTLLKNLLKSIEIYPLKNTGKLTEDDFYIKLIFHD